MKINLNKPVKDLNGSNIGEKTMAEELAVGLSQQAATENPLKIWEWCLKLAKNETLELDSQDFELFKNEIKKAKGFTVFFMGQVLKEISQ